MTAAVNPTSKEALIATFKQPRPAQSSAVESVQDRFLRRGDAWQPGR